jgi:hypothetical protein
LVAAVVIVMGFLREGYRRGIDDSTSPLLMIIGLVAGAMVFIIGAYQSITKTPRKVELTPDKLCVWLGSGC